VARPTPSAQEQTPAEFVAGRRPLARKVVRFRPRFVAFLGLGAYRHAFARPRATLGEQAEAFRGARVWVLPSPSGLNANYQMPELVQLFRHLWQQSSTTLNASLRR
jgi:TDG/mug DNA glycosylase family protein